MNYNTALYPDAEGLYGGLNSPCTLGSSDTIIYGYADSTAEQYANAGNHAFLNLDLDFVIPTSGIVSDGISWSFKEGTLTISGTGAVPSFETHRWDKNSVYFDNNIPSWFSFKDSIRHVVIEDGITAIGGYAFINHYNLETISIPDTVETIENDFISYSTIKEVTVPKSVTSLSTLVFYNTESLEKVTILNPNCEFGWTMNEYMIPESAVIYGYKNSTVQKYAEKFNRTFVALD